jgi:hypothetical protein
VVESVSMSKSTLEIRVGQPCRTSSSGVLVGVVVLPGRVYIHARIVTCNQKLYRELEKRNKKRKKYGCDTHPWL